MLRQETIEVPIIAEPKVDRVLAILRNARDRIKRSWTKGALVRPGGSVCMVGSVLVADNDGKTPHDQELSRQGNAALRCLARAIPRGETDAPRSRVITFNDHPQTQKSDVLGVYDRAIEARKRKIR